MIDKRKRLRKKSIFHVPMEIEATLIIRSEKPEQVAGEIADLNSIEDYRLLPQDSIEIYDRYFDTSEHALQSQRLALRIREVDGVHLIALKGSSETIGWGSVERLEIEELWSRNGVTRVVKELRNRRVALPQPPGDLGRLHPVEVMTSLGLKMIQNRDTYRKIRNIVFLGKGNGPVLAELAIDSVEYNFWDQKIRHHEVEIEVKVEDGSTVIERVTKGLIEMYGTVLRRWKYSKLATGKALEKLLSDGALGGLVDINNNLKPAVYDKIDGLLSRGNI
jgi:inorganic triphosphatase YgiF